jgi:hypothetical protein
LSMPIKVAAFLGGDAPPSSPGPWPDKPSLCQSERPQPIWLRSTVRDCGARWGAAFSVLKSPDRWGDTIKSPVRLSKPRAVLRHHTCPNPAYVAAIGVPVMCFRDRIMYRMEQSAEARGRYPLMETLGRGCAHVWRSNSSRMLLITRIGRCGSLEAQQGRRQQCRPQIGPTRAHR